MSNVFTGLCVGGPHDGKMRAHPTTIMPVALFPPVDFTKPINAPVAEDVRYGEYVHTQASPKVGLWNWKGPTP